MEIEYVTFYISYRLPKRFKISFIVPVEQGIIANVIHVKKELVFSALAGGRCVRF